MALKTRTTPLGLTPGQWTLDERRSRVGFGVLSLPPARGSFSQAEGRLVIGADESVEIGGSVGVASLSTGLRLRDWHLRGPEFFDAKRHPQMRFASTAVEHDGATLRVRGRLTIRGITRTIELTGTLQPDPADPRDVRVSLAGTLARRDFRVGTVLYTLMIGRKVRLRLDLVARRAD